MAFPHPQSRKDHDWYENIARLEGIVWQPLERTVNVTEDRNTEDEMNPAEDRPGEASVCGAGWIGWFGHDVAPNLIFGLLSRENPVGIAAVHLGR
jgi:hypothetical protein